MAPTVGQKIEDYAIAHRQELKKEEAKTGKKFTKYDIAMQMLSKGQLSKADYASWMNTREGFDSQTLSKQLEQAKISGVFGFPSGGEESYLDSIVSFSSKSAVEKTNVTFSANHGLGLGATKKQKAKRQAEIDNDTRARRNINVKQSFADQKFQAHLASLPEVKENYQELMDSIEFKNLSKSEQIDLLMKRGGERFYEAWEKGDYSTAKAELLEGFGLAFQKMDDTAGITKFKEWAKERTGLNALVEWADKAIDDGDDANLSKAEQIWENLKGVGDFADSLVGTQGIVMIGAFMALGEAVAVSATSTLSEAAAAKAILGFQTLLTTYFGAEGAKLVYDGIKENLNASTKEEARAAGQKLGNIIMLYGAAKGAKSTYENAKGMYQTHQVEAANKQAIADARKTLGIEDGVELTEANLSAAKKAMALKAHPDKGGSVEAMQQVNAAYDLLKASITPAADAGAAGAAAADGAATPNTPVEMTHTQEVQATRTSYKLMTEGKAVSTYKGVDGKTVEVLDVPEGTTVSTPSGYKTVGKDQVVTRENGALNVKDEYEVAKIKHYNKQIEALETEYDNARLGYRPNSESVLCGAKLQNQANVSEQLKEYGIEVLDFKLRGELDRSWWHDTVYDGEIKVSINGREDTYHISTLFKPFDIETFKMYLLEGVKNSPKDLVKDPILGPMIKRYNIAKQKTALTNQIYQDLLGTETPVKQASAKSTDKAPTVMASLKTAAQKVQAKRTSHKLMTEGKAVSTYKGADGNTVEVLDVPEGTTVSTPSGYKTVGKDQVVTRENGALNVKDKYTPESAKKIAELDKQIEKIDTRLKQIYDIGHDGAYEHHFGIYPNENPQLWEPYKVEMKTLETEKAGLVAKRQQIIEQQSVSDTASTPEVSGAPKNYRARLETPDYSNTRSKFPADAIPTETKPGKATAYTTTGEPDGIVYRGADGKLYVPNKWNPESPHEVKPGSVIMIYDEAGGDFAVGEPTVIAKTYRNPATNQIDPLYDVEPGRGNAIEIQKDVVPSAFKIVPEGTVVKTKEAPNGVTVKSGQAVMYDIDGDPYVVDIQKTLLKRQAPVGARAKAAFKALKEGKPIPDAAAPTAESLVASLSDYLKTYKELSPDRIVEYTAKIKANKETALSLAELKNPDGSRRLSDSDICNMFINIKPEDMADMNKVSEALDWTEQNGWENKAAGVWKYLY